MKKKIRIGALISGGGTNLQAIIDSCESGKIDGQMVFVGSDNPDAKGLERAQNHKIPTFVVDYTAIIRQFKLFPEKTVLPDDFHLQDIMSKQSLFPQSTENQRMVHFLSTRAIAEAELIKAMEPYPFNLLVLAGFMRNLTPYFIDKINKTSDGYCIMNIHPALLPAFPGVDGYGDTFRYGCKVGGCTVHFIDYGEDSGPIIGQKAFQILETDTLETVKSKGLALEWQLYPECIQMFAQGRITTAKVVYIGRDNEELHRTVVKIIDAK
jgi:phosphoribosylglycinamide formyltransferase-1